MRLPKHLPPSQLTALAIALLLPMVPGVGVVQSIIAATATILIGIWWQARLENPPEAPVAIWVRLLAAIAAVSAGAALFVSMPLRSREWYQAAEQPEVYWMMFGGLALLGVGYGIARGAAGIRPTAQALTVGFVSTAVWVPIGHELGLHGELRFHPHAVHALGLGTLLLLGASALRRHTAVPVYLFCVVAFAQSISLYMYWASADAECEGMLGYLWSDRETHSKDGRLRFHVLEADGVTRIMQTEVRTGETHYVKQLHGTFAGLQFVWKGPALWVSFYEPPVNIAGGCSDDPANIFWDNHFGQMRLFSSCVDTAKGPLCNN